MKNMLLSAAFLALMAAAGTAQVTTHTEHRRRQTLTILGGTGLQYGTGYGYGFGYGGSYSLYGTYGFSPYRSGGWWGSYRPWGVRRPVYAPWYGGGYSYSRPYLPMDTAPPPSAVTPKMRGVADRQHEIKAGRRLSEGMRLFKQGKYEAARDAFREAVIEEAGPRAEALFALSLVATGDAENADKALRSAAEHAPFGGVDLDALFGDAKERTRILSGSKGLVGAWLRSLDGKNEALKKLAEKDPVAKKLLGK